MAEEMDLAEQHLEPGASGFGLADQTEGGALIKAEHEIVGQRQRRAAKLADPDGVADAQLLVQGARHPTGRACRLHLDPALERDDAGKARLAALRGLTDAAPREDHRGGQRNERRRNRRAAANR